MFLYFGSCLILEMENVFQERDKKGGLAVMKWLWLGCSLLGNCE